MTGQRRTTSPRGGVLRVGHLTTVDLSLRFLLWPQLLAVVDVGAEAYGISSPGPWVEELEEAGIRHIPLESSTRGVSLRSDLRAAWEFWRALRATPLTILHTHNPKPGIYGRILGRLAGVPVVVNTLHGFYATETDALTKRAVVYGLEAIAARFSDAELHQNIEDLELARRLHIVDRSRSQLLGNGIDLSRFDPTAVDPAARQRIRAELGADDSDVVVGTVGRLVAEKGFPELFEAVSRLGSGFVFAVIGPDDPDKPDALPRDVVAKAENSGVRFLGMRKDMEDLYSAMDLFILPSHREGFPRAAMEAAAMGLPVVATDIRGCRQVVEEGVNGLLIPVRDPRGIEEALRTLAADPERRRAMSTASREIAEREFDDRKIVEIVLETYRHALEEKGLAHLMPAGMVEDAGPSRLRRAGAGDAAGIANLYVDRSHGATLPQLGRGFARILLASLLQWPGTTAFVTEDQVGITGYAVAVNDSAEFLDRFLRSHWLRAALSSVGCILEPAALIEGWRRLLRPDRTGIKSPEVVALGMAPRAPEPDSGEALVAKVVESLAVPTVVARVEPGDAAAIAVYERVGFERDAASAVATKLAWRG